MTPAFRVPFWFALGSVALAATLSFAVPQVPRATTDNSDSAAGAIAGQVAMLDTAKAFEDCQETKLLNVELRKREKAYKADLTTHTKRIEELKAKRDAFKAQDPEWSAADALVQKEINEHQRWLADQNVVATRYQCHLMDGVFKDIQAAAGAVAARKGIRIVVSNTPSFPMPDLDNCTATDLRAALLGKHVVYADPHLDLHALDITREVVAYLDSAEDAKAGEVAPPGK